ncbi:UDP-forming cellulose synthase catalytic subunit [Vibrio aphrogenes]|uniref:UDP-forming cellulose synthase catalytic subunit n=1 Tax=Vibrio aphrogenes TaxID=1891186 RepID=UPI000B356F25|nr:UDP-forming cellulose synthase catalytic subunit [Vibrio aphrogenes]
MFSWLKFFFQPTLVMQFRHQLSFYAGELPASKWGKLFLSVWFVLAFILLKPTVFGKKSWQLPYFLFPHIDFARPSFLDPVRFLIQALWVLLIQQAPSVKSGGGMKAFFMRVFAKVKYVFYLPVNLVGKWTHWLEQKAEQLAYATSTTLNPSLNKAASKSKLSRSINLLLLAFTIALAIFCFTVPFSLMAQAFFVVVLWAISMMFRKISGRFATMLMIVLSVTVSCRYLWWRVTSTLNYDDSLALLLGVILLIAEIYSWIVLMLGYFQNIWPLKRKPVALPENEQDWPTIDLMIPTYNEDLDVVRATVYAALGVDWPSDKLNIYILDDGKRDSFRDFAKEAGVGYIRRPLNNHAKAGNINYALQRTSGEYVAIFDCDHIPTRAFFQLSMGWFIKDPKLAMIQTPHHFFSPDPFERNLSNFRDVPNEGNLFYGLIQDGNDLWDSTFFCGSCAVIRREPLEAVGGIAVETVTEDAHTSLRMHRLGYRSAYLRKPLSAGLATETLSAHIGQRIRWARGMAQIFRVDNPFTGKGLKWQQRLCYANAMLHFLSGIPRIVYLLAPLAFLILHTYIIFAPALAIILYVLPHMVHSSMTNSRMQGDYRHSFWGEVYETVLSWYIARPTTVALFAPHKGTFNVTAKGGLIEKEHYDWSISTPYIALVALNVLGVGFGIYRLFYGPTDELSSVAVNLFWVLYNLLILGGAVAVAEEAKQVRKNHRVNVEIPMSLTLKSGHMIRCIMKDFSLGGIRVELPETAHLQYGHELDVVLQRGEQSYVFPMKVVYSHEKLLGLQLLELGTQQQIDYVQCTFARADTWAQWQSDFKRDKPLLSMYRVLQIGAEGYRRILFNGPIFIQKVSQAVVNIWHVIYSLKPQNAQLKSE